MGLGSPIAVGAVMAWAVHVRAASTFIRSPISFLAVSSAVAGRGAAIAASRRGGRQQELSRPRVGSNDCGVSIGVAGWRVQSHYPNSAGLSAP
jgi:hypothetical protein